MLVRPSSFESIQRAGSLTRAAAASPAPAPPRDRAELSGAGRKFDLQELLRQTADEAASLQEKLPEHVQGDLLVKVKPGMSLAALDEFAAQYNASLATKFDIPQEIQGSFGGDLLLLKLGGGMTTAQGIAAIEKDERVLYASSNDVLKAIEGIPGSDPPEGSSPQPSAATNLPNDLDSRLWGMHKIDAPEAWAISTGKRDGGPILCVIDTGVDYNHSDLSANIWTNPREIPGNGVDDDGNGVVDDVHGYNAYRDNGDPLDDHSHGSHCSGTIAGVGNNGQGVVGVNWEGRVMGAKFLSSSGSGSTEGAIKAVLYATRMGARITSNSWGGGGYNQALYDVLKASPALHIFAAGNESNDNDRSAAYPASYDLPNIIAVAATDNRDRLASFSNWGATTVDIGAPGVDIFSTVTNGRYGTMSGTSMATPHVAGVAGLVATVFPNASNQELKDRILRGADPVPSLSGKCVTGGRLNVFKALENDTTPPATPGDFGARSASARQFVLGWTAPGDDGMEGQASGYEVRFSDHPITDENSFRAATLAPTGQPAAPGSQESLTVGLTPSGQERTLYVAMKTFDNAGNYSEMTTAEVRVPGARVAFEDNADGGPQKWTPQGTWGQVEEAGRGKVWTDSPDGNYGNKKNWALTSQKFSLAGLRNSTLFFDCKHQIEERHDNVYVEVSKDGKRWSEVARYTGNSDWKKQYVDLSAYDGQDLQVRFRLKTDRSITFDGFSLDNVVVAGE